MGCALALLACTLAGCDDHLEVRQAYDFSLSSWYLQEGIEPDETVEIRLTLNREGDYREARYRVGYIQLEGDGEVFAADGTRLVNRELTDLSGIAGLDTTDICRQVFTRDPLRGGGQLQSGTDAGHPVLHRGQGKCGYNRLTKGGCYDGTG